MYDTDTLQKIYKEQGTQSAVDYLLSIRKEEGREMRLYLANGYVNIQWIRNCGCSKIVILGGRGTGKTYSILADLTDKSDKPYIMIRRTKTQIEECCSKDGNPYYTLNRDKNWTIEPVQNKHHVNFYSTHLEEQSDGTKKVIYDDEICFATSLSTFYNLRGFDGNRYDTLFFDEIIKEPLERSVRGEGKAFLNMIETIQRNRELDGKKPLECILAGNTDSLDSEILQSIGAIPVIERMKATGQEIYISRENDLAIFDLYDSPISKIKAMTTLYKNNKNKSYTDMAVSNTFTDLRDTMDVQSRPLAEYKPIFVLNDQVCIYQHKSKAEWYVAKHVSGNPPKFNLLLKEDRLRWKELYFDSYIIKTILKKIIYESYDTKVLFDSIIP